LNAEQRLKQANDAFAKGDFKTAVQAFRDVIKLHPEIGELYINLGAALKSSGERDAAEQAYRDAIKKIPKSAIAWFNLGNLLRENRQAEEALKAYRKADKLQPGTPEILNNLGTQLYDIGAIDDALKHYDAALSFRPTFSDAMTNRGNALQRLCRMNEAEQALRDALKIEPQNSIFTLNMSAFLAAAGRHDQAIEWVDAAIDLDPKYIDAHLKKASLLIQQGRLEEGLSLYESRWQNPHWHSLPARIKAPRWNGEDLSGKHLITWNEQGFGDAIMYARYITILADQAETLTIMCEPTLHDLFRRNLPASIKIIGLNDLPPPADYHVSMMSVPHHFGVTFDNLKTEGPYLTPNKVAGQKWRETFTLKQLQVGLIWAGNPRQSHDYSRSLATKIISPVLDTPNTQFHNLLIGPRGDFWRDNRLIDPRNKLNTFDDTAAYMDALDLIISVDSAPAHLAGAIGKKTWVLLSFDPDTRYFLGKNDNPWYPTMTLYRQQSPGEWGSVVDQICDDLKKL